jgi:cytochrome c556
MRVTTTFIWVCLAMTPVAAVMAEAVLPVVRERQADMKAMSAAAKSIAEYFSGRKTYDAKDFRAQAMSIAELGGERIVAHFSTAVIADGSQAREEVGIERAKFQKLARDLAAYARQVAAAAADGETMPGTMRMRPGEMTEGGPFARKREEKPEIASYSSEHAFHMMLQTCSTCHAAFRVRR